MIFDAASEGKNVIIGMLIVGLIFCSVIALGELSKWLGHRRDARRRAQRQAYSAAPSKMSFRDLREWIALLEREGELVRVGAEVDPHLEVTEIVDRTVRAGGPALLFERPKGSEQPLLINQFGTERRMCLAFGVERLDDVAAKLADVLELQPPEGLAAKVRGLKTLKSIADSRPKVVRTARARRSCCAATTSTSAGCRCRPAGRATPARSSRCRP